MTPGTRPQYVGAVKSTSGFAQWLASAHPQIFFWSWAASERAAAVRWSGLLRRTPRPDDLSGASADSPAPRPPTAPCWPSPAIQPHRASVWAQTPQKSAGSAHLNSSPAVTPFYCIILGKRTSQSLTCEVRIIMCTFQGRCEDYIEHMESTSAI